MLEEEHEAWSGVQNEECEAWHGTGVQVSLRAVSLGRTETQVLLVNICLSYTHSESRNDRPGLPNWRVLCAYSYLSLQRFFLLIF